MFLRGARSSEPCRKRSTTDIRCISTAQVQVDSRGVGYVLGVCRQPPGLLLLGGGLRQSGEVRHLAFVETPHPILQALRTRVAGCESIDQRVLLIRSPRSRRWRGKADGTAGGRACEPVNCERRAGGWPTPHGLPPKPARSFGPSLAPPR
ncbi:hypothetical protein P280DRAFT_209347 [Massarina eburnea CBS 473.64]|uniref:Uncharacterized protein n=1 Tax=Massarina eburnea CBS 473.64 TaxID=1395130 RepID=A0A6A6RHY0_9PLEO|nr:hypothetical protein P280DRAFT_209347 [Massarina eburnea CBS 473.64]